MKKLISAVVRFQIWRDNRGQDLIEYALMAGFVAVSAGALMPGVVRWFSSSQGFTSGSRAVRRSHMPVA